MKLIDKIIPLRFKKDVLKAIEILENAGCTEIYIFGSLVKGTFSDNSDIDFAVKGLPGKIYFKVAAKLNIELEHNFDLIRIDDKEDRFGNFIEEKEEFIRVA